MEDSKVQISERPTRMKSEQSEGDPTRWIHGGTQERPEGPCWAFVSPSMRKPASIGERGKQGLSEKQSG